MIDNLPAIYNKTNEDGETVNFNVGFPIGF